LFDKIFRFGSKKKKTELYLSGLFGRFLVWKKKRNCIYTGTVFVRPRYVNLLLNSHLGELILSPLFRFQKEYGNIIFILFWEQWHSNISKLSQDIYSHISKPKQNITWIIWFHQINQMNIPCLNYLGITTVIMCLNMLIFCTFIISQNM